LLAALAFLRVAGDRFRAAVVCVALCSSSFRHATCHAWLRCGSCCIQRAVLPSFGCAFAGCREGSW